MAEKARWENLRPLPERASAAQDRLKVAQAQVTSHQDHMRGLQQQQCLAEAEHVRLQTILATAAQELRALEALIERAKPPPVLVPESPPESDARAPPVQALAVVNQWMAHAFTDPRGQHGAIAYCRQPRLRPIWRRT